MSEYTDSPTPERQFQMRPSRVLKKLRAGKVATCTKLNLSDPRAVEIAAMFGFDCLWLCMEHVPGTMQIVEEQIRAAKMYDVDSVVRVPRGSYSDTIQPLEADAAGIMVPHIMSLEDARNIVSQTRFHPIGRRPVDGGNADGAYCNIPFHEYIKQANEQRFVAVQIEDPEPLDELDDICQLDGIDIIFFGPGDFSQSIGHPGQTNHPEVQKTRQFVAEVANKHGKVAATICAPEAMKDTIDMGYRFISSGADVICLSAYFRSLAAAFAKAM